MKKLKEGIWQHEYRGCDIVINENTNEIRVKSLRGNVVTYDVSEVTLDELEHVYNLIDRAYGTETV